MKLSTITVAALAVVVSARSEASYELLLVADYGTDSVHRFDAVTGAYFGSFGAGMMADPAHIAVDKAQGVAYVTNYQLGTVQKWNYSSGTLLGEWGAAMPWGIAMRHDGNLLVGTGNGARVYAPSGQLLSQWASGSAAYGVGFDGSNYYVGLSGSVRKYSTAGIQVGSIATGLTHWYGMTFRDGVAYGGGYGLNGQFGRFDTASMTGYAVQTVGPLAGSAHIEGYALSHGMTMYMVGRNAANTAQGLITRWHLGANASLSTFGSNVIQSPAGMAIVLAPEPATLLALGAGLVVLRRRRKS